MKPRRLLSLMSILVCTTLLTCIPEENLPDIPDDTGIPGETITRQYPAGDTIHVFAEANPGFEFSHWTMDGDSTWGEVDYIFIMPERDIEVIANFIEKK